MAIVTIDDLSTEEKITLEINNGDFEALKNILKKYRFRDYESLIRFAFVALLRSEDNIIQVTENGQKIGLRPNEALLNKE